MDARTRRNGNGYVGTNTGQVMPPKFDGTTPCLAFHRQFEAAADDHGGTPSEKAAHLLNVLQGRAVDILHSVPTEATYEDIVEALIDSYADLQPASAYRSQLKARTQANGETLQEFAAAIERLARRAFVGLPAEHVQREAACAFVDGVRDGEIKHDLLKGDERPPKETLNQALRLEAVKAAAWPTARLRKVTRVPTGRPPTSPERHRNERPVCWRCVKPGHFRRYCRQRPPEEMNQDPGTKSGLSESSITPPRSTFKVLAKWAKGSLTAVGWIQEKPCRVTIDNGASVTVARPDIVAGLPESELSWPYVLQTTSGKTIPVVK
jgi:hypothetical protein